MHPCTMEGGSVHASIYAPPLDAPVEKQTVHVPPHVSAWEIALTLENGKQRINKRIVSVISSYVFSRLSSIGRGDDALWQPCSRNKHHQQ